MAKALQCPACGTRHALTELPDTPTFRCTKCGRTLKVPAQLRPQQWSRARTGAPPATEAPPPAEATNVMAPSPGRTEPAKAPPPQPGQEDGARPVRVPLFLRLLAWLIALPLGLAAVVWPARQFGFLSGQRLLDVVVGTGWSRYWRVLLIAPAWALVTTILVQLMIFGMRKLGERRRSIRAERDRAIRRAQPSHRAG